MLRMVNFMLWVFYHNKTNWGKKLEDVRSNLTKGKSVCVLWWGEPRDGGRQWRKRWKLSYLSQGWKWKSLSPVRLFMTPWGYTVYGILQDRILKWVTFTFSRGSSQSRDPTQVSRIVGGFFTSWATREAQEYCSGSLSLLQGIFPTQESNQGLLHCTRILYQLSYEGSLSLKTGSLST